MSHSKAINNTPTPELHGLISQISELVTQGRAQVRQSVNQVMVQTYWQIGRLIVLIFGAFVFPQRAIASGIHLYGGTGHNQYLGCFSCNPYSPDSICNEYGQYGSTYSSKSIWNQFSTFGNKFSLSSPWNAFSSSNDLPVLVDKSGGFYGYFTINQFRSNAFSSASSLYQLFDSTNGNLETVRKVLCESM